MLILYIFMIIIEKSMINTWHYIIKNDIDKLYYITTIVWIMTSMIKIILKQFIS